MNVIPIQITRAQQNVISAWSQFQEATGDQVDFAIIKMDIAIAELNDAISIFQTTNQMPAILSGEVKEILGKWNSEELKN